MATKKNNKITNKIRKKITRQRLRTVSLSNPKQKLPKIRIRPLKKMFLFVNNVNLHSKNTPPSDKVDSFYILYDSKGQHFLGRVWAKVYKTGEGDNHSQT